MQKVLDSKDPNYGYNAAIDKFEDLMDSGIIDPTKVGGGDCPAPSLSGSEFVPRAALPRVTGSLSPTPPWDSTSPFLASTSPRAYPLPPMCRPAGHPLRPGERQLGRQDLPPRRRGRDRHPREVCSARRRRR